MNKDTILGHLLVISAIVIIFLNMFLFGVRTDGTGNKFIYCIVFSFVTIPLLCLEWFFYFFKPIERFKAKEQSP